MSRSMLIKRLDELQRAGVIETQLKPDGRGYNYRLTDAGADLAGVTRALGTWGRTVGRRHLRTIRSRLRAVGLVPGTAQPI